MLLQGKPVLPVDPDNVPWFLKNQAYWTNWKPVYIDGKARKVQTYGYRTLTGPYYETEGRPLRRVTQSIPENGGIGFILSVRHPFACIDIDDCRPDDERLRQILELAPDAWCEYSPSGNGIHVWGVLPDKESYRLPERKQIGYSGKKYEWYAAGRSLTVTGHHLTGEACTDLTKAILFIEKNRPRPPVIKHEIIPVSMSVSEILDKAFEKDPDLRQMYYHGHSWQDKSAEDFHFCRKLWFWLGGHGEKTVETVFRNSAMYREHKGNHYPGLTVKNAERRWNGNYYGKPN